MTADPAPLHLVRLSIDAIRMMGTARSRGIPLRDADTGYLMHCQLSTLFGGAAPRPFVITEARNGVFTILGYSSVGGSSLLDRMREHAGPDAAACCDPRFLSSKRMPHSWPTGKVLGFQVRACPVIRMNSKGPHHKKGAEVDVFLSRCWAAGGEDVPVDREKTYRDWLASALDRSAGAHLLDARLLQFKRERVLRRTQDPQRKARRCERPVALLVGALEIVDSAAFGALVRRGVGRHRAFGFGALLLRRRRTTWS